MDAAVFASSSKPQKRIRDEDVGSGKDFISRLHDDILHQILSFLPTKDLVRTSMLSTRFRKVWTFFSVIDIDVNSVIEELDLRTRFLDLVIPSTARIRKFRLEILALASSVSASDLGLWVEKLIKHKVEELDLYLPFRTFYRLPSRFFSSSEFTTLKLEMNGPLLLPNSTCFFFPRLKVLHLSLVSFSSVRSTLKLFDSCPVLEELVLYNCFWGRIDNIVLSFPSLRTLLIDCDPFSPDDLLDSVVKIAAPNLVSFKCTSYLTIDLGLCNLCSLEEACISVMTTRFENHKLARERALKLLHGVQTVESLILSNDTLETLATGFKLHSELPTFNNLKHLQVECACSEFTPRELIEVLQNAPNLHSLSIGEGLEPDALSEDHGILKIVPKCFKTSLKRFELASFNGTVAEVCLLKYFLENATLLEKISIICSDNLFGNLEKREEIGNELDLCRRGASSCVVEFLKE